MRSVTRILSAELLPDALPVGLVELLLSPSSLFVDRELVQGRSFGLDPAALMELMAQAFAAVSGYLAAQRGERPRPGFLVGCRELRVYADPALDVELLIETRATHVFAGFVVFTARAMSEQRLIAEAELKVFLPEAPLS